MTSIEAFADSTASPDQAWQAWTDVGSWPDGDLILSARLDGPFAVGSTITSQLRDMPESDSVIVETEQPHLWVNETRMTDLTMSFEHHIEQTPNGCRLTERAVITGSLADEVAPLLDTQLRQLFAESTALIAKRAEALAAR